MTSCPDLFQVCILTVWTGWTQNMCALSHEFRCGNEVYLLLTSGQSIIISEEISQVNVVEAFMTWSGVWACCFAPVNHVCWACWGNLANNQNFRRHSVYICPGRHLIIFNCFDEKYNHWTIKSGPAKLWLFELTVVQPDHYMSNSRE